MIINVPKKRMRTLFDEWRVDRVSGKESRYPQSAVISPEHGFAKSTRRFVEVGQTGDALLQLMCGLKTGA
ncbi:MAG: hypothetical protein ACXWEQ_04355 [Halobacteriota archaeon]